MAATHDVGPFLDRLARLASGPVNPCDGVDDDLAAAHGLFDAGRPVVVARAPGRLDVMGGIADYSGSLVLQMPIGEAALVAMQAHPAPADTIRVLSLGGHAPFEMPLSELFAAPDGGATPLETLRARLSADPATSWAAYVVGVLGVLAHEPETRDVLAAAAGLSVLVASSVPEGKGVSSSAAVEVGTMMAALGTLRAALAPPERIALLCQRAENFVVGAPCGVMDQMASALGHESRLLPLLCQPATVRPPVPIPAHLRFWGIDSGVRHSVGGSDYGTVRAATFMARTVLRVHLRERNAAAAAAAVASNAASNAAAASIPPRDAPPPAVPEAVADLAHLVDLSPSLLAEVAPCLPRALKGEAFLKAHGTHGDAATQVQPGTAYDLAGCAAHPVHEHFRVGLFERLLTAPASGEQTAGQKEEQMVALGELMYQSHASYSAIGLGSAATDLLVQLVRASGPSSGLYGAKITGGGSGGTVCVLAANTAQGEASFRRVLARYEQQSRHTPYVVSGSSVGAVAFGHLEVDMRAGASQLDAAAAPGAAGAADRAVGSKRTRGS